MQEPAGVVRRVLLFYRFSFLACAASRMRGPLPVRSASALHCCLPRAFAAVDKSASAQRPQVGASMSAAPLIAAGIADVRQPLLRASRRMNAYSPIEVIAAVKPELGQVVA